VSIVDYTSDDCSIPKIAVPKLAGFLEDPPSCTVRKRGVEINVGERKCVRAELISVDVVSNATCRIVVTTVSSDNNVTLKIPVYI